MRFSSLFKLKVWKNWFMQSPMAVVLPDKTHIKMRFKLKTGKKLNLENPQTFNEKLQWLKLYDRKHIYTTMVDKYEVKQYIAERIGEEYIIPTLGVWDSFDDIDFDALPNQFVLKCTHDSGGLVICKDKNTFDKAAAKEKIEKSLKRNYFLIHREWPYKNVKRRIIAEKYMEDSKTSELRDYKFFCFDGVVRAMFIATERQKAGEEVKFDFYDADGKHLELRQGHPNATVCPEKPKTFDEMKRLAEKLSKGIPQVRVDFYEVNGKVYFGELTFSHFAGMVPFEPEEWDYTFGSWIELPEKKDCKND
ncbi:MAG: glycosyl transferase [Clostridia bacterium]|nr:glycosyl transferase [Clostridia bacterium]